LDGIEAVSGVDERARELLITTANIDANQVLVTVSDTGTGLDPNAIGKIFEPFYTTKGAGMGMGLSICRSILQNHGGRLWASANDGPGATFRRLSFTYTEGWPGIALLLMRIAAGAALVAGPGDSPVWHGIRIISGILLVAGLWTPIAGTLVVVTQVWLIFDKTGDAWAHLLLGIMGAALALLGPGFWSVDTRLFGWKRIDLPGP
jgi:uncharacterized membrane protein YphA (DoxX/SURF4 family)